MGIKEGQMCLNLFQPTFWLPLKQVKCWQVHREICSAGCNYSTYGCWHTQLCLMCRCAPCKSGVYGRLLPVIFHFGGSNALFSLLVQAFFCQVIHAPNLTWKQKRSSTTSITFCALAILFAACIAACNYLFALIEMMYHHISNWWDPYHKQGEKWKSRGDSWSCCVDSDGFRWWCGPNKGTR